MGSLLTRQGNLSITPIYNIFDSFDYKTPMICSYTQNSLAKAILTWISSWQRYCESPRSVKTTLNKAPSRMGTPSLYQIAVGREVLFTRHSITTNAPPSFGMILGLLKKVGPLAAFCSSPAP